MVQGQCKVSRWTELGGEGTFEEKGDWKNKFIYLENVWRGKCGGLSHPMLPVNILVLPTIFQTRTKFDDIELSEADIRKRYKKCVTAIPNQGLNISPKSWNISQ